MSALGYQDDLTPEAAWQKLATGAILVDVRTDFEWNIIGIPDTAAGEAQPLFIQWNLAGGAQNPRFLEQLSQQAPEGAELVFLCRSGVRSVAAARAATAAGYTSFNVLEGFEGAQNAHGERTVNGWRNRGLPWKLASASGTAPATTTPKAGN